MADMKVNQNAAAEAARRQEQARIAAEQARQAAAERARLQAEEAKKAEEANKPAPTTVARDAFVQNAKIEGTSEQDREALYTKFDKDGEEGLSDDEFDAAFADAAGPIEATVPQLKVSKDVQEKLDHANQDDKETAEDLKEGGKIAKTPDDVQALMAAAEARGVDQGEVLQEVLKGREEGAETPETEMYDAVAAEYDRLGKPETAAAVRAAGDPELSKDVRKQLTHALQDGTGTDKDLRDAAPDGSILETSPPSVAILRALAARLLQQGGAAILIDYGYAGPAIGDTLQAVRGHAYVNPFEDPGEADL
ncbi:MAG: SAM-dependent methyltransferase, partial [Candidatus Sericytochromatia bacterium]